MLRHAKSATWIMLPLIIGAQLSMALPEVSTISTVAGTGSQGFSGDGGPALMAELWRPRGLTIGPDGSIYIADQINCRVRVVTSDGTIHTFAGRGVNHASGDGGPAAEADINCPSAVAFHLDGSLLIAGGGRIRRVDTNGIISTIAGAGADSGSLGERIPAIDARMDGPRDLVVDDRGNIYVAEGSRVRKIDPNGIIRTIAGSYGKTRFNGNGLPARVALLSAWGIDLSEDGKEIYFADASNNRIRKIDRSGIVWTVAGNQFSGYSGDGVATLTTLSAPQDVLVDGDEFYIADGQGLIRQVDSRGLLVTIAGHYSIGDEGGPAYYSEDGTPGPLAHIQGPAGLAKTADGRLLFSVVDRIRALIPASLPSPMTPSWTR